MSERKDIIRSFKRVSFSAVSRMEHAVRGIHSFAPEKQRSVRNFLVLQFESPLGSVVHATPLFETLKRILPDAHITVATSAMAQEVLGLNPYIDRCVRTPNPIEAFAASIGVIRDLLRTMPPGKRCILTTIGNQRTRVAFIGLLAGKSLRAGYTLVPELYDVLLQFDPERGQIEANLDILRNLGHSVEFCEPRIFFSQEDAGHAAGLLQSPPLTSATPRIAFVTQNSGGQRNSWREDRFSQVVTQLSEMRNANPIFVGTFTDIAAIEHLRQSLSKPGISVAGRTSVRQLAALLAQCDLVVSLDTGTFHVARAVGLPGAVIAPAWQSSREWLPVDHPRYRVLQGPRIPTPPPGYWIDEISAEQVIEAALDLLDRFPPSEAERTARTQNSLASIAALRQ